MREAAVRVSDSDADYAQAARQTASAIASAFGGSSQPTRDDRLVASLRGVGLSEAAAVSAFEQMQRGEALEVAVSIASLNAAGGCYVNEAAVQRLGAELSPHTPRASGLTPVQEGRRDRARRRIELAASAPAAADHLNYYADRTIRRGDTVESFLSQIEALADHLEVVDRA